MRLTLGAVVTVNIGRLLVLLAKTAVRYPLAISAHLVLVTSLALFGGVHVGLVLLAAATLLGGWALVHRMSFLHWVGKPVRSRSRCWWVYRRPWPTVVGTMGLTKRHRETDFVPRVRKVTCTPYVDSLLVQLLSGQSPTDYEKQVDPLAHAFHALRCRVRVDRPGRIWLDFIRADPLLTPVTALPISAEPDLTALRLGVTESGRPWLLKLLGCHVLVAGATGAGKGSVLWSLIRALCPLVRSGAVQVWAVDPKGGMELAFGAGLFHRLAYRTTDDMLLLLEDAVTAMRQRQARLIGVSRLHSPTDEDPLVVIVIDEMAALTAYTDRETKRKAAELLQLLLSQGRAVGVLVVAALQDPGKDVLPFRDLFPTRIALRLTEDMQVDMVLGRGARDRGAVCDQIAESTPGVGYVQLEGCREPVRVRAGFVTDADIASMAAGYSSDSATTAETPVLDAPRGRT
jgi:S-DNA-T family DNA segregation ATPase FtsK/SpoIIIE